MIRVVYVKSKTLYEEDGEDMYEKDLLYITTYMYMILSLHELISRCHLVNFDLLPPSTFKIHNMTQFCVFVFFSYQKHHDSVYFVYYFPTKQTILYIRLLLENLKTYVQTTKCTWFLKYFSTSGQRNFLLFFPRDMELISGAG